MCTLYKSMNLLWRPLLICGPAVKLRARRMLGKHATTELHPLPCFCFIAAILPSAWNGRDPEPVPHEFFRDEYCYLTLLS